MMKPRVQPPSPVSKTKQALPLSKRSLSISLKDPVIDKSHQIDDPFKVYQSTRSCIKFDIPMDSFHKLSILKAVDNSDHNDLFRYILNFDQEQINTFL